MRFFRGIWVAVAWLHALPGLVATQESKYCHEFPVVVVSAVDRAFPDPTCNQRRYPAEDCLKAVVTSRVEVIDHAEPGRLNCYKQDVPTAVYNETKTNYRGQTSLFFGKHQLNVKFPEPTAFVGMAQDKGFILNGPFLDCSLLRNHMAHWLYRATGRYSPHSRHVAVYFRADPQVQEAEYRGIYLLLEKLSYGPNRVNLAKMDSTCAGPELNGGWAWQNDPLSFKAISPNMVIDQYQNEFGMGERPLLAYPSADALSQKMRDYFVNTSVGFLPQLYRFLWNNMTSPDALEQHVDLGSFADYILHTELSLNVDAYRRSTFFFKDRDQPINAGPVWDLNLAYGNGARRHFQDWIYPQYTYWKRLMCNYKLTSLVIQRWKTLRTTVWSDAAITAFVDESAAPIQRQLVHCKGDWRSNVLQCATVDLQNCNGTYEEKLVGLKTAVLARSQWMDTHITQLYKKLDAKTCSGVGTIPQYNCAADGNDAGCLTNPERYYSAVKFPPVRKPFDGPACGRHLAATTSNQQLDAYSQPSVDHCWQSAGLYVYPGQKGVRDKSLTFFCNGYGKCPQGPGAKCVCAPGMLLDKQTCERVETAETVTATAAAATTTGAAVTAVVAEVQASSDAQGVGQFLRWKGAVLGGLLGCVVLTGLMVTVWRLRKHPRRRQHERLGAYHPVQYGSVSEHRRFVDSVM